MLAMRSSAGGRDDPTKCAGNAIACIVGHNQQDVRRTLRGHNLRRPVGFGILGGEANLATEARWRGWKIVAVDGGGGVRCSWRAGLLLGARYRCQRGADHQTK